MKSNPEREPVLREYLLGDLAEEQQERLEQSLMTDSECFRDLQVAEDELIASFPIPVTEEKITIIDINEVFERGQ